MSRTMSFWLMTVICAAMVSVVGCDQATLQDLLGDSTGEGEEAPQEGPGEFQADYRTSPSFFTWMPELAEGTSPHGRTQIWYSSNAKEILELPSFVVPEGTVAIKEFDSDGVPGLDGIAVMVKKADGYDPEHNDWYYEMRNVDGEVLDTPPPGKTAGCISCHAQWSDIDYLPGVENRTGEGEETPQEGPGEFQADYRTSPSFFTWMPELAEGTSPHGRTQIWYSSNAKEILELPSFVVPEGTVAIKEFDSDGVPGLDGIAVMVKKADGYDPEHNDWYYEMRDVDGEVLDTPPPGKTAGCISCHAQWSDIDYLPGVENR